MIETSNFLESDIGLTIKLSDRRNRPLTALAAPRIKPVNFGARFRLKCGVMQRSWLPEIDCVGRESGAW
jgi:hypothetical protein